MLSMEYVAAASGACIQSLEPAKIPLVCCGGNWIGVGHCRGWHDHKSDISKFRPDIINIFWFVLGIGCICLPVFDIMCLLLTCLVLVSFVVLGRLVRLILLPDTTEQLRDVDKLYLLRHKYLEWIKFYVECESSIGIGFETRFILRYSLISTSRSSTIMSMPNILLIQRWCSSLVLVLGLGKGLDNDGDLGIFQGSIYLLLRSSAVDLILNLLTYFDVLE